MKKAKRSSASHPANPPKRNQQMSLGGILLTLLVALITWWSGIGRGPAAPPVPPTATPLVAAAKVETTIATTAAPQETHKSTPQAEIKVVSLAQPDTPTARSTVVKTVTPKAARAATATPRPTAQPTNTKRPTPTVKPPTPTRRPPTPTPKPQRTTGVSGLPTIHYDQLPREAKRTLALIDQGGPFPFYQDGSVFQNRERVLPRKPRNYYHEYTVITPGEDDRGARRIVAGDGGELFYTDDHYESFREVVR